MEATDRQIDQLVYELYGLSAEDVKIAEAVSPDLCYGLSVHRYERPR